MDELIGTIKLFAGTFAPQNYMYCAGQRISISHNCALFSILGTTYGGDGVTTFAIPDLRTRLPVTATISNEFNTNAANEPLNTAPFANEDVNKEQSNTQPYIGLSYIICSQGIYPSRP